jgi:NADH-quinone oxidoreductase subunit M
VVFTPLIVGTLVLGVYPGFVFDVTQASSDALVAAYKAAIAG